MKLLKPISPALDKSLDMTPERFEEKWVSVRKNESTECSKDIIKRGEDRKRVAKQEDILITEVLCVKQMIYVQSFAEHAPFHRHPERIIKRLVIYTVSKSVNFGRAPESSNAKAWCV